MKRQQRLTTAAHTAVEALEGRVLQDATPWAWNAVMIHQDDAVANFPWLTGQGQTVVVIDTGALPTHGSLATSDPVWGKVTAWADFVGSTPSPVDNDGHGTGVSGILVGNAFTLEGKKDQGIATGANLIVLRTDDAKNKTPWATQAARISQALDWVIAHQAQYNIVAVNLSTGGTTTFTSTSLANDPDAAIDQQLMGQFATLAGNGVFIAAAAGNDGIKTPDSVNYPAADPNVYAVSSVNSSGAASAYASRGALVDLLAPGENITMPYYFAKNPPAGNPSFVSYGTGTSFATPQITGAAVLLKEIDPTLTPAEITAILQQSGTPVTDPQTGHTFRLLNLDAAIKLTFLQRDDLNDHTLGTATTLTFNGDTASRSGLKSLIHAQDYYKFSLTNAAGVTFAIDQALTYELLNSSGNVIANLGGGALVGLEKGTYYVRVTGGSATLSGTYGISITRTPDDALANHTLAAATLIPLSNGHGGLNSLTLVGGLTDYYRFVLGGTSDTNVTLSYGTADGSSVAAELLNSSGVPIGTLAVGGTTQQLAAGTYYVRVSSPDDLGDTYNVGIVATPVQNDGGGGGGGGTLGTTPASNATTASIVYDANNNLHLAWQDTNTRTLMYAQRAAGGTTWTTPVTIDAGFHTGDFCSIAVDPSGNVGIAYYDAQNADLKYAHFNGATWDVMTIDSSRTVGQYPSLTYTSNGTAVIAYFFKNGGSLKVATQAGAGWNIVTVDTGNVGRGASIAYDAATGQLGVGYDDVTRGWFKYAYYKKGWHAMAVDTSTRGGGGNVSLKYDANHLPQMSYYDAYNADMKFARYTGSRWITSTVAGKRSQGLWSTLTINPNGSQDVVYYNATTRSIVEATSGSGGWTVNTLGSGGLFLSKASTIAGGSTLSWIDDDGAVQIMDL